MERLKKSFPERRRLQNRLRPNVFSSAISIQAVGHTFVEALILFVMLVLVFLKHGGRPSFHFWRFPLVRLRPPDVFSIMLLLGFSLNTLCCSGSYLAIGIVGGRAIVRC